MTTSPNISPLDIPTRTNHAQVNGCQVTTPTAMPEPVLHALAGLVDALAAAFRAKDDADREADREALRRPCRWHAGQYADFCGPCRSERIGRRDPEDDAS